MSEEELNKQMEFIVEQQARFAVQMEMMREAQAAETATRKQEDQKMSGALVGLMDIVGILTRAQMKTDETVNLLTDEVRQVAQAQKRTEESLTILINVIERHIGGNGSEVSPA